MAQARSSQSLQSPAQSSLVWVERITTPVSQWIPHLVLCVDRGEIHTYDLETCEYVSSMNYESRRSADMHHYWGPNDNAESRRIRDDRHQHPIRKLCANPSSGGQFVFAFGTTGHSIFHGNILTGAVFKCDDDEYDDYPNDRYTASNALWLMNRPNGEHMTGCRCCGYRSGSVTKIHVGAEFMSVYGVYKSKLHTVDDQYDYYGGAAVPLQDSAEYLQRCHDPVECNLDTGRAMYDRWGYRLGTDIRGDSITPGIIEGTASRDIVATFANGQKEKIMPPPRTYVYP